jgi:hypothetical protein
MLVIIIQLTHIKDPSRFIGEPAGVQPLADPDVHKRRIAAASDVQREFADRRLAREWQTLAAMIRSYCRGHHGGATALCSACQDLHDYAHQRLTRCVFGPEKPTCVNCPVHCYQRDRRDQVKAVMRYAGPRMLWQHPILCLFHWIDGLRKAPAVPSRN